MALLVRASASQEPDQDTQQRLCSGSTKNPTITHPHALLSPWLGPLSRFSIYVVPSPTPRITRIPSTPARVGPPLVQVLGRITAGVDPDSIKLSSGQCAYITTGAKLPRGADAVVKVGRKY